MHEPEPLPPQTTASPHLVGSQPDMLRRILEPGTWRRVPELSDLVAVFRRRASLTRTGPNTPLRRLVTLDPL